MFSRSRFFDDNINFMKRRKYDEYLLGISFSLRLVDEDGCCRQLSGSMYIASLLMAHYGWRAGETSPYPNGSERQ